MIKLRKLTAKESWKFQELCKKDELLHSNLDVRNFTSGDVLVDREIDPDKKFNNKLELGAYLYEKLGDIPVDNDVWHFLVIVYHKQLLRKNGRIGEMDRFYINPQKSYYPFTHLLKSVFDLYSFYYGKTSVDFLLLNPVNESGRPFLETVKRQDIMKILCE